MTKTELKNIGNRLRFLKGRVADADREIACYLKKHGIVSNKFASTNNTSGIPMYKTNSILRSEILKLEKYSYSLKESIRLYKKQYRNYNLLRILKNKKKLDILYLEPEEFMEIIYELGIEQKKDGPNKAEKLDLL